MLYKLSHFASSARKVCTLDMVTRGKLDNLAAFKKQTLGQFKRMINLCKDE